MLRDERGVVAVIVALLLPLLIGMVGLAVEVGLWFSERRSLQTAADAAAIAGAFEVLEGYSASAVSSATTHATNNGFDAGIGTIDVNWPPESGTYVGDATAVEVILTKTQSLLLSALFLGNSITISARAVAVAQTLSDACVIALHPTASGAISAGGSANVNMDGCGVAVNSTSSSALSVSGSGVLDVDFARTTGGYSVGGSAQLNSDQETWTNAPPTLDPYADLSFPAPGACNQNNYSSQAQQATTINPGVYCSGLRVSAGSTVTMNPGTYYIDGGSLNVNGSATLTGNGVTIILTGSGSDYATVTINGGAQVSLTAPTEGNDFEGVLFFQDHNAPTTGTNRFNGGSTTDFSGALYFPSQEVQFTGGNVAGGGCTRIVARTVGFSGNADLDNDCTGLGVPPQQAARPTLVE